MKRPTIIPSPGPTPSVDRPAACPGASAEEKRSVADLPTSVGKIRAARNGLPRLDRPCANSVLRVLLSRKHSKSELSWAEECPEATRPRDRCDALLGTTA